MLSQVSVYWTLAPKTWTINGYNEWSVVLKHRFNGKDSIHKRKITKGMRGQGGRVDIGEG